MLVAPSKKSAADRCSAQSPPARVEEGARGAGKRERRECDADHRRRLSALQPEERLQLRRLEDGWGAPVRATRPRHRRPLLARRHAVGVAFAVERALAGGKVEGRVLRVVPVLAREVELLSQVRHKPLRAARVAAAALEASAAKREPRRVGGGVAAPRVAAHSAAARRCRHRAFQFKLPVGPVARPPRRDAAARHVGVRRVGQLRRVKGQPRWHDVLSGASTLRLLSAPIREGRVVVRTLAPDAAAEVLEQGAVRRAEHL